MLIPYILSKDRVEGCLIDFRITLIVAYFQFEMMQIVLGCLLIKIKIDVMLVFICVSVTFFYCQSVIDVPSKVLTKLLWEDVECQPHWNASVRTCQVIGITIAIFPGLFIYPFFVFNRFYVEYYRDESKTKANRVCKF